MLSGAWARHTLHLIHTNLVIIYITVHWYNSHFATILLSAHYVSDLSAKYSLTFDFEDKKDELG